MRILSHFARASTPSDRRPVARLGFRRVAALLVALSLCAPVLLATSVAHADPNSRAFQSLMRKARTSMDRERPEQAIAALEKAREIAETNELHLLLAQAYGSAERFNHAVLELAAVADVAKGEDLRAFEALLNKYGPQASPIGLTIETGVPGAEVIVDGQTVGTSDEPVRVRPGRHTFVVSKAGYSRAEVTRLVLPGRGNVVSLPLARVEGTLRIITDTSDVVARFSGQEIALVPDEAVERTVGIGKIVVEFTIDGGAEIITREVTVTADEVAEASLYSFGRLVIDGIDRPVKVVIAGDTMDYAPGDAPLFVPAGEQTLLIGGPGVQPIRGDIRIAAGKTTTVSTLVEDAPVYTTGRALGWTALGTGLALLVATVVVEEVVDFDSGATHDAVIWSLAGAGAALTVTGGVVLREIFASEANPAIKDVNYGVQVGVMPTRHGGAATVGFSF
jgi:hypothetical protein